jgi:cytochrome d ubiquinol oxidase subunit I
MDDPIFLLSRIQFALTIMFHYIFPPLSIGLGTLMVFMEGMYLRTGDRGYHLMTKFWTKIFAANFAMGVATGIVMEFQFGTNWGAYSRYVGDIFGSALAAEGIFAFFLESGFLAVLVFGWDRVSPRMHFVATVMVALGSIFSAIWIIVANSWQQVPVGYQMATETINGVSVPRAVITDFWAVILSRTSLVRLLHTILGAFIQGAFFVMSISAWYVLRRRHLEFARRSFTIALIFGTVSSLAMMASGHLQGRTVAQTQPAKLAAFEGHFKSEPKGSEPKGTDLYLVGFPDTDKQEVKYGLAIPGGLSFLVHDNFTTPIPGLDKFNEKDRPSVPVPFAAFHMMVGLGSLFVGLTVLASYFRWRGTLFEKRWLMWLFVVAVGGTYVANQAGWVAAETGRQPFVVYPEVKSNDDGTFTMAGGLRTQDGLSNRSVVTADKVLTSIVMFSLVYALLFAVWVYVLNSKIQHGPDEDEKPPPSVTTPEQLLETAAVRGAAKAREGGKLVTD